MAIRVRLTNKSQVTKKQSEQSSQPSTDNTLIMSRALYQRLGSLVANKTILDDYNNGKLPKEYVEFLDACEDINFNQSFPDAAQRTVEPNWSLLDEYLGDLGTISEYAYSKDLVNIPEWLSSTEQSEYRVLMDTSDNTHLTDSSGAEILVSYNNVSIAGTRRNS